ncbi:MAG TPA: helix-turn-helix domain-containing protein [Candidatus Thermoplasmatota archaeon]|nr:helix-turn-helix domain-containing protein [Candidatus Thermoplasmatota archaeon]
MTFRKDSRPCGLTRRHREGLSGPRSIILDEPQLLSALKENGLTGYASKAYVTLLRLKRSKVMPLARISGIPRNKLYHVLVDLEAVGLVERLSDDPLEYAAKPLRPYLEARIVRAQALLGAIERIPVPVTGDSPVAAHGN